MASEQEQGPYYIDKAALRQDVTEGKRGVPLRLRIALVDARSCAPLVGAALDIWHCDAQGVYSGFSSDSFGGPGGPGPRRPHGPPPGGHRGPPPMRHPSDATRFLRGVQLSNPQGIVEFATIYPGWYQGRSIHIHMKVHAGATPGGQHVAHTGQLFFPEDITEQIAQLPPYASRLSIHRTTHDEDGIFGGQHGAASLVTLERLKPGSNSEGFIASATLAIDPQATPAPVQGFGGGSPPGPPPDGDR